MRLARGATLVACLGVIVGCVSVPMRGPIDSVVLASGAQADAIAKQETREQQLRTVPTVAFSGRVALSNGRDGGSGRIEFTQTGDRYAVTLSAPVTRQSWTLAGDAERARIDGVRGGPRESTDVSQLLKDTTGFDVPVGALAAWASGTRADTARFGTAMLQFSADGRLASLQQGGWTVDYLGWQGAASDPSGLVLPVRINAHRDAANVRLAVDDWSLGP